MADSKTSALFEVRAVGTEKASRQFTTFERTATGSMTRAEASVGKSLARVAAQYMSMAVGINKAMKVMSSGMEFNKFIETQTMAFTVMMKSAERAKAQMEDLYNFAVKSPLTFKDTASAAKQLMAYGFAAKELVPTMDTLGTVALATGHSLGDIAYVYGTLRSQGRAYSRDLMQFGMRGIPIYEELAKVMGVNVQQIQKLTSQGKVGFREVEKAFQRMTSGGGRFSGMIEQYMDTLTGKLAMLEDIAEKSAGSLMGGVFAVFKGFVDSLITLLEDPAFQKNIDKMAKDLEKLAKVVLNFVLYLVKHLPQIISLLKILIALKIGKAIFGSLNNIPNLLNQIGDSAFVVTQMLTKDVWKTAGKTLATSFGNATAGASLLKGQIMSIISLLASPAFLLLAGIGAAIAYGVKQNKQWAADAEAAKSSDNMMERIEQLKKDYSSIQEKAHGSLWQYIKNIVGANEQITKVDPSNIQAIAKEYNITEQAAFEILRYQGLITTETWNTYNAVKATNDEINRMWADQAVNATHFASTLDAVGISMDDLAKAALASAGFSDLIADFEAGSEAARTTAYQMVLNIGEPSLKYKTGKISEGLPSVDNLLVDQMKQAGATGGQIDSQVKSIWEARVTDLNKYLSALLARDADARANNILNPETGEVDQNTGLIAWLLAQISYAEKQLGGSAEAKKLQDQLADWWLPRESEVAATVSAVDDVILQRDKAIAAAEKEIAQRKETLTNLIATTSEKQELVKYQTMLNDLSSEQKQIIEDIIKYQDRLKGVTLFEELTGGVSGYFEDLKALVAGGGVIKFPSMNDAVNFIKEAYKVAGEIARNAIKHPVTFLADAWEKLTSTASTVGSFAVASAMEGTELGSMKSNDFSSMSIMGTAGTSLASFATSIENVTALLNPLTTAFEAMRGMVEPLTNAALEPLVAIVEQVGEAFGKVLAPFLGLFQIVTSLAYGAFAPLLAAIDWLSGGFLWFFDYVIMPVGNTIIKFINAFIRILNKLPGVHIRYLKEISRSTKALKDFADAAKNTQDALKDTIAYLEDKLKDIYDKQLDSLQDLYEVGAISATEYEKQVKNLNDKMVNTQDALVSAADQQLETQEEILQRLLELYKLQDAIDQGGLSDEQIAKLLEERGLTSKSMSEVMIDAITTALTRLGIGSDTSETDTDITIAEILSSLEELIKSYKDVGWKDFSDRADRLGLNDIAAYFTGEGLASKFEDAISQFRDVYATGDQTAILEYLQNFIKEWTGVVDGGIINKFVDLFEQLSATSKKSVNDAIISPNGNIITTAPDDYLIATKTPGSLGNSNGTNITVNVNVQGSVTTEKELASSISSLIFNQRSRGILSY